MNTSNHAACREKAPGFRLAVLHRLSAGFLSGPIRALGLKLAWIACLIEVLERPGQSQDALARGLRLDRAAMARTLFELENHGYVVRREDDANRRVKRVFATDKATAQADTFREVLIAHNEALFRGFDAARQARTLELLDAMIANLETALAARNV